MEQCKDIVNEENYKSYIYYLPNIFLQMEAYLLHDKEGKLWYENEPCHIGSVELYDGFLKCIKSWEQKWIINVHTLNHDLLFESFNKTDYFANHISDGFDEYGSEYYCTKKSITKVAALDWKDILVDTTRLFVSINYMEVSTMFHFIDTLKTVFS